MNNEYKISAVHVTYIGITPNVESTLQMNKLRNNSGNEAVSTQSLETADTETERDANALELLLGYNAED